jgi:hypothetical protein
LIQHRIREQRRPSPQKIQELSLFGRGQQLADELRSIGWALSGSLSPELPISLSLAQR